MKARSLRERFLHAVGMRSLILIALLSGALLEAVAQTASSPTVSGSATMQGPASQNYKIGPGDVLDVSISKNEVLSRTGIRVRNDGTIQLEMLGEDVPAACLTERQLADSISGKYRKYLVNPYVNVSVKEFNASPVAVIGAVNAPGRFQLQREYRLVEMLALVNGPGPTAGTTVDILRYGNLAYCDGSMLIQPKEPGEELISIELSQAFKGADGSNPVVMPGDIIRVSTADQMNAYIQGLIKSSAPIPLKEPVTLTQAIAMAGGPMPGAQLDKVVIRRPVPGSINRSDLLVNVKEINKGNRDDVLLQPNDIVEIPGPSGVKKVLGDILKTVVPSIGQLPMRVVY
jgi:polysaccharide biosynthesis/export protein